MLTYFIALILIIWSMIFTAARFLQYFKIVKEYTGHATAKVLAVSPHERKNKKEKKAIDVKLGYVIDGKEGSTEIIAPQEMADQYLLDKEFPIVYKISGNGAVHIATDSQAPRRLMIGYGVAIFIEFAAFVVIWWSML